MTSIVAICNMALIHIGARGEIASLGEASEEARHCRIHVEQVRDELLRLHRWSFAAKRLALADLGDAPAGWAYRYALPDDCLLAREIVRADRRLPPIPFRLEGGAVLTDQPAAVLLYTARVTDPGLFDPSFVAAFAWALADRLAAAFGTSAEKQQRATQQAQIAMAMARANDASEDGVMVIDHTPEWVAARGGQCPEGWR